VKVHTIVDAVVGRPKTVMANGLPEMTAAVSVNRTVMLNGVGVVVAPTNAKAGEVTTKLNVEAPAPVDTSVYPDSPVPPSVTGDSDPTVVERKSAASAVVTTEASRTVILHVTSSPV
jgi:hypothetical protein